MKFFAARRTTYHTNPRMIDDVIYTPYVYEPPTKLPTDLGHNSKLQASHPPTGDLLGVPDLTLNPIAEEESPPNRKHRNKDIFEAPTTAEIFLFEYGTVVLWGMTEAEEKRFLSSLFVHPSSQPIIRCIYHRFA